MDAGEYDKLNPDEIEAAVASGSLAAADALALENARLAPRAEVLNALSAAPQPTAVVATSEPGPTDGPQDSGTVAGPTTPAVLATEHGTQDEPRDYQADDPEQALTPSGTQDEPRGYLQASAP